MSLSDGVGAPPPVDHRLVEPAAPVAPGGMGDAVKAGLRRPAVAGLVLLLVYVCLAQLCDPNGFLGTDTGGKVATVKVMSERGDFDPDVGYWAAEWDPDADVHGLMFTTRIGDRFVNVTSLPMVLAARPLYDMGGYRATLLLPMAGSVVAAFAARALARRGREGNEGWGAFWVAGLASPLAVYALDLWEHSIGIALMGWAVVLCFDARFEQGRWWSGIGAGLLFGAAASMRTEALVYGLVTTAVVTLGLLRAGRDRRWRSVIDPIRVGMGVLVGVIGVTVANGLLERMVLGETFRSGRASGAASSGLASWGDRVSEGMVTVLSPFATTQTTGWVMGLCAVGAGALVVWRSRSRPPVAVAGAVLVGFTWFRRLLDGSGFVPGMLAASPVAVVGLVRGWQRARQRFLTVIGVVAVPMVVAFQYLGGAAPQWGGRYLLMSSFLLTVVGVVNLHLLALWAQRFFVVVAVGVTAFGVTWLAVRSADFADAGRRLDARNEDVLITQEGFLPREFGATYPDQRWLAASPRHPLAEAADVARQAGVDSIGVVEVDPTGSPPGLAGWQAVGEDSLPFVDGLSIRVTTYERVDEGRSTD